MENKFKVGVGREKITPPLGTPLYGLSDEQLKYMADAVIESVKEMQAGI